MKNPGALAQDAHARFRQGDYAGSVIAYTRAIGLDPHNEVLYSNRSASYALLRDYDSALDDARKCVLLKPEWSKGYLRLCKALDGKGMHQQVIEAAIKGLDKEPKDGAPSEVRLRLNDVLADARGMQLHKMCSSGNLDAAAKLIQDGAS
ncbi:hypothetical protein DUNSADRAFT_15472, partial [Dunaliella salina]